MTRKWSDCQSEPDKWRYHAHLYAWRRIYAFAANDEKTSPVDPDGKWFNEDQIRHEANVIRANRRQPRSTNPDIEAINERYRRADAWRAGNLDKYDAIHHPDKLAERHRLGIKPANPTTYTDLGVTSQAAE